MQRLGQALLVYAFLGAASPMMLRTQEDPAVLVLGLLVMMSWQGVLGSIAQGMTAESSRQYASCWKSWGEQQEGKLMTHTIFWSMLRSVLTMVMSICCLQPSVLKQDVIEMLLVMSGLKVGKMTLAELTMVQVQSNTLRQIMLKAPLDCEAGVHMPQMVITQLVAVSWVGSVKEKMMRQLTLSIEKRGQRITPSERVMMMLSLAGSKLTSLRSCPMTKANSSSLQSILGSENWMDMVLQLSGLLQEQRIWLRLIQLRLAIVVIRIRQPVQMTYCTVESQRQSVMLWLSDALEMPMPQTTRVKFPAVQKPVPRRVTVTLLLSELEMQVTGILVPLDAVRKQVLVATVIPLRDTLILPYARRGLEVPKLMVQQVLTTPIALSWQLTVSDCSGEEQSVPPLVIRNEFEDTILWSLDLATQMQQLGRSQVYGMCTRSMQKVKGLVEVTQVKGTTVRYIPPVMQTARGARLLLPKVAGVAIARVAVVSLLIPFSKKDHCVERMRKDLPPVTIPLLQTTTDTLVRQEPALPWMSALMVVTAPLAEALQDPELRQYCPAQEKSQSLVMRLQNPTWQQKQLLLALICVSGMSTWKGVVAQEVSEKVMAMRSKRKIWVWLQGEPAPWQKVQVTGMLLVQGQFCMLETPAMLWMPQLAKRTIVSCWLGWTTRLRLAGVVDSKRRKLGQVWKLELPVLEQKLLTQLKLTPASWLSCGMAWRQVRQRQEVGLTTSLLQRAMQSGQRFLLEELRENMRLERVMVVLELQGKRLGTVLLQTVLALMVILKQLGVWKQLTRQALLVSAFQKLTCLSQQCAF